MTGFSATPPSLDLSVRFFPNRGVTPHWLECLIDPGTVVELRAPELDTGNGFKIAVAGFFDTDHLTAMAVAANHPGVRAR